MTKLRAPTAGTVIVTHHDFERSENGHHQTIPGSETGLVYGREVHPPVGIVLASGDPELQPGDRCIIVIDLNAPAWGTLPVQTLRTHRCPGPEHWLRPRYRNDAPPEHTARPEEVFAVLDDDDLPRAIGRRIVGELLPTPSRSSLLLGFEEHDGYQRARVTSVGPEVEDVAEGDVVLYRPDAGNRWSHSGRAWVSLRAFEVDAVVAG